MSSDIETLQQEDRDLTDRRMMGKVKAGRATGVAWSRQIEVRQQLADLGAPVECE